jgi:NAD(P)-dependent dehydrogenase (short-subunit alcohol dehydrogenase family)
VAVIVTGGTLGIGRGITLELAARGHDVVAFGAVESEVAATSAAALEQGVEADVREADVSIAADVYGIVAHTLKRYGRIDGLVNNAAIGPLGTILDTDEALWDRILAVNLKGPYLTCRAVLPHMIAQGGGAIVNIGSGSGWGKPNMFAYSTSKGGIFAFSAALAYDYFRNHIRVNTVVPGGGGIPTGMSLNRVGGDPAKLSGSGSVAGRPASPRDVACAVAFLLSPEAEAISGTVIDVGCFDHQGGPIPSGGPT